MQLGRLGLGASVAAIAFACDTSAVIIEPPLEQPSWAGAYSLIADTVRYCTESATPTGYVCNCTSTGRLEGTLSLAADATGKPTGEVKLRECPSGGACGAEATYAVVPYTTDNPTPPATDRLHFCAGKCPWAGNDGGIRFINAIPANPLIGSFSRFDGSVRGCGIDSGPFVATRQ